MFFLSRMTSHVCNQARAHISLTWDLYYCHGIAAFAQVECSALQPAAVFSIQHNKSSTSLKNRTIGTDLVEAELILSCCWQLPHFWQNFLQLPWGCLMLPDTHMRVLVHHAK